MLQMGRGEVEGGHKLRIRWHIEIKKKNSGQEVPLTSLCASYMAGSVIVEHFMMLSIIFEVNFYFLWKTMELSAVCLQNIFFPAASQPLIAQKSNACQNVYQT